MDVAHNSSHYKLLIYPKLVKPTICRLLGLIDCNKKSISQPYLHVLLAITKILHSIYVTGAACR